jgi:hypothetical protein
MRTWLTAAAVVLVMSVAVTPVQADFLGSLHQGASYTYTFANSATNNGPTGVVFLKANKSNRISSAQPFVLLGDIASSWLVWDLAFPWKANRFHT